MEAQRLFLFWNYSKIIPAVCSAPARERNLQKESILVYERQSDNLSCLHDFFAPALACICFLSLPLLSSSLFFFNFFSATDTTVYQIGYFAALSAYVTSRLHMPQKAMISFFWMVLRTIQGKVFLH